ncbi:PepSY domain-containing protein [Paenibacillus yanchengensis]|uniref:PepSY domain-containing protein n=1 Tax=Paenibacillus yanchengensis TaxID=2035833 RepID=A0ABW4YQ10_9BACL
MQLNLKHEGQVWITYVSERKRGVPDVYTVRFDTIANRLDEIYKPFREDKNDPGNLHFSKWKITDEEAFHIALKSFNHAEERFEFENYKISTTAVGRPSWIIIFYHDKNMYRVRIDAYLGEVIDQGS